MLFTDIEGSTALLSRLGDRYWEALSAHRDLMRAEFAMWRGREQDTQGDSFFVVFDSAVDAVACAAAAQHALAGHDWPAGETVRVRMGLHSGQPARHEDSYIGMDVHRAARIAATAHGGQVILSEPTRQLADPLPGGLSVRDLGFHRLKDISDPERIYQLAGPGLRADFPPLKSLGAQTSLPIPATPLVGRDDDLARLRATILKPGVRVVTMTGTGGVGKTRLALAAAAALDRAFRHGVFFAALAPVTDPEVMWKTLADTLDVSADGPVADAVTGYLAGRQALLVLDNLEQLPGAGGVVAALLAGAPGLVVLATSRGPLRVHGEHEFPVAPLEVPGAGQVEAVAASGSARLFAQQAEMVRPGFAITADNAADVAAICARLDGLPLAIELAASRVRLLAPRAVLARLEHSLGLAAPEAGRPLRQQTLRNTIAWSYELLAPALAQVFRRMSVFAGGCELDALAAVAATDGGGVAGSDPLELVVELQDVSLITVAEGADGEPRLGMLETIREYARERLEQEDDLDGARRRHAEHYAAFAERANEQLEGPMQLAAMDRLEAEHDNLRAALAWSLEAPAPAAPVPAAPVPAAPVPATLVPAALVPAALVPAAPDRAARGARAVIGLRLVQALILFWYQHGHATEGRQWLQRAMDLASADGGAQLARVAHGLGVLMDQQGEADAARLLFERSLAIWRELGDRGQQARELNSLGITHRHLGDVDTARANYEEAVVINRETANMSQLGASLANLGQMESAVGNFDRASEVLREALTIDSELGDPFGIAVDQHSLAEFSLRAGRPREARDILAGLFDYVGSSGNTALLVNTLELAAAITACLDDPARTARLLGAAEAIREESGMLLTAQEAGLLAEAVAPARASVAPDDWHAELAVGRALSVPESLALLRSFARPDDQTASSGRPGPA
jgi:predicted ATPase/class 3 adenylate cyclase